MRKVGAIRSMVAAQTEGAHRYLMLSSVGADIQSESRIAHYHRAKGYADDIRLIFGYDPRTRTLLGMKVLESTETPGLGDAIEAEKSDWILGFEDRSLGRPARSGWAVKKDGGDFDQFTGATITPRAVVDALRQALEYYAANSEALFRPVPEPADRTTEGDA